MSAERDLLVALRSHAPLMALLGGNVAAVVMDEVDERLPRPYIVGNRSGGRTDRGLDGSVHMRVDRFDLQCVADTRDGAKVLADAVRAALDVAQQPADEDSAGYDPALGAEVEVVSVEWWV